MEIIISNPKEFEELKQIIKKQGTENIVVLADFNKTFTKAFIDNKEISTSFASIRDNNFLGEEYIKSAKEYFEKYHPIEISNNVSFEEKSKAMHEWWMKHFEILIKYGLNKRIFLEIVDKEKIQLRKGVKEFFEICRENKIPVVIISSGLGNFIPELLKKEKIDFENIYVYSNMFKFDENGNAIGIGKEIIHTVDKKIKNLNEISFYLSIKNRKNIFLLGDDLTDLNMINGFSYDNLIKIGFLNKNINENLEKYKQNFDVIITGDGDFDFVNDLLKELI